MDMDTFINDISIQKESGNTFSATLTLQEDLPFFQGHFPGNPVFPGVGYIFIAEKLAERFTGYTLKIKQLKKTKFFAPSRPGDILNISGNVAEDVSGGGLLTIQVSFTSNKAERICSVKMIVEKKNEPSPF